MKTIRILSIFVALLMLSGCGKDFLDEEPKSFYAPETVLSTPEGFETALIGIYPEIRKEWALDFDYTIKMGAYFAGTDMYISPTDTRHPAYDGLDAYGILFNSEDIMPHSMWGSYYKIIGNANQIINHAEQLEEWGAYSQAEVLGEAKFFRAFAYRALYYFFGDVPIVKELVQPFRTDFARNPKQEVLDFIIEDLTAAVEGLPTEAKNIGRVTKGVAHHLLGEMLICDKQYDAAITALDAVINNYGWSLVTSRFGVEAGTDEGDFYSDIHKRGNANDPDNTEAMWVIQQEYGVPGGDGWGWEKRIMIPYWQQHKSWAFESYPEMDGPGRGRLRLLDWVYDSYEENDIRNSKHNLRRFWLANAWWYSPAGDTIRASEEDKSRGYLYPYMRKHADYIDEAYWESVGYKDRIYFRLAETYFLKAEAQLLNGDEPGARATVNIIRARAGATDLPILTMDELLNERAREVGGETHRRYTLVRTGTLVDRVKALNPNAGPGIEAHNMYFPIPQSAIDANTDAVLEQNDGY